jgi:hypothetical protein
LGNFDLEIGRKVAREDAENQLWKLEGYLLQNALLGRKVLAEFDPIRPEHYQKASLIGIPFLTALHPFSPDWFERECYVALESLDWHHDAYLFQAAAYFWRLGQKYPVKQDLKKALWCLERRNRSVGLNMNAANSIAAIAAIEKYLAEEETDG